jgi:hypothetical protein
VIKNKIIRSKVGGRLEFETALDKFIEGLDSYSIQYKPLYTGDRVVYTALISYQEEEEEPKGGFAYYDPQPKHLEDGS